ncbi:hypothetical protein R50072_27840 [Simiduia litorea]|uniref:chondroitinase-B domain-containing protein n=1 Tax=Simiduia litorea TaxID=1435348 RepID=UPI0036F1CE9A
MYKQTLLSLAVTAILAGCGGSDKAPSNQNGMVSVTGTPSVGATLTATVEDQDGVVESSIIYAWYADGRVITGATGQTYVITTDDIGKEITVIVGYQGKNGVRESQTSAPVAEIPASVSVAATFIHGLVTGGSCSVYVITETGAKGNELASATTANGAVSFGNVEHDGYGLIECTGGTYLDEATGTTLTAPLTRAVVDMSEGGDFVVSPLTEMAVQLAEADAAGLRSAVTTYNALVATKFGLSTIDITTVQPTNLQTTAAANDAAGKYATVIALISQVDDNEAGSAADIINDFAADLRDGSLSSTSIQLLVTAEADLPTSSVGTNLNLTALDAISVAAGMTNTPGSVAIQGSASVGSTLTAAVTDANGFDSVSYQWSANGVPVNGATTSTLTVDSSVLGDTITVMVTYTDNSGFSEQATSAPTGAVTTVATNTPGSLGAISGLYEVDSALSVAAPTDANGISGSINYQWKANGEDIANANASTYTLSAADVGKTLSVAVTYTDNDGFDESLSATATDIVFSAIVNNTAELTTALADSTIAVSGAIVGLSGGAASYVNVGEIKPANGVTLTRTAGSGAVLTGQLCLEVGNDVVIDGLAFDALDYVTGSECEGNGVSFVFISGINAIMRNNSFLGEAVAVNKANYVTVKGYQVLIERNYFTGKNRSLEGAYVSTFANSIELDQESHTIQYNHFSDAGNADGSLNSSAMALQIGRTTGSGAQDPGYTKVQYNLFEDTRTNQRVIRVQSGENIFHGNTFDNTDGVLGLEDGFHNTVTDNIFAGANASGDGAIAFAPLGHVITGNYINNLATTSSDKKAGLVLYSAALTGSGNAAIIAAKTAEEMKVTVANNTIINAKQAILLAASGCSVLPAFLEFSNNLIANQSTAESINGNSNGAGRSAIRDSYFPTCSFNASTTFNANHFYSESLSNTGHFAFADFGGTGNIAGAEDGATLTAPNANNMVEGSGADANIGADIDGLTFITSDMVGPGSTWTVTLP